MQCKSWVRLFHSNTHHVFKNSLIARLFDFTSVFSQTLKYYCFTFFHTRTEFPDVFFALLIHVFIKDNIFILQKKLI